MNIKLIIVYTLVIMNLNFINGVSSHKNKFEWTEEEKNEIKAIQENGLSYDDKNKIKALISQNPWLSLEEATAHYQIQKVNKVTIENLLNFALNLAGPLKLIGASIIIGNTYSLFKPLFEPFVHKYLKKFIFKNSIQPEVTSVTFNNIAGYGTIKKQLNIIIKKLQKMKKQRKLEKIDGLLFYGDPGCGKTFFAQALANEANVAFFNIKASDLINEEGLIGDRIQLLFEKIRFYTEDYGPCILLIDEIDFLITNRNNGKLDNNEKIILQDFLSSLDGTKILNGVLVIGSTNYKNSIDIALLRNGRLGNHIEFSLPTLNDIKEIVITISKKMNLSINHSFSIDIFCEELLGKNITSIIQSLENIKDFMIENKYELQLTDKLINEFKKENIL